MKVENREGKKEGGRKEGKEKQGGKERKKEKETFIWKQHYQSSDSTLHLSVGQAGNYRPKRRLPDSQANKINKHNKSREGTQKEVNYPQNLEDNWACDVSIWSSALDPPIK